MKLQISALLAALAIIPFQTGCERHPASETIPGHAEKAKSSEAQAKEKATQKEATDPNAPSYFPEKKN
ncbi:MAG: hypothetical protein NTZ94_10975 [Verrucomicrobia bacterium]|nr:hypothetical protein [Verrucomicrobiota bacterium]